MKKENQRNQKRSKKTRINLKGRINERAHHGQKTKSNKRTKLQRAIEKKSKRAGPV